VIKTVVLKRRAQMEKSLDDALHAVFGPSIRDPYKNNARKTLQLFAWRGRDGLGICSGFVRIVAAMRGLNSSTVSTGFIDCPTLHGSSRRIGCSSN
jgi:hypothetical protein